MGWEHGVGGGVVEVVAHVGEEGSFGLELLDELEGVLDVGVGGVVGVAESVEYEDVEVLELVDAFVGDGAHVREVGGGAEAVGADGEFAMIDRDAAEGGSEEGDLFFGGLKAVEFDAGDGSAAGGWAEGVVEDALNGVCGGVVGVERKGLGEIESEGAKVVKAEDMVGVGMGVEDSVDAADILADGLVVEVWAGVDEDAVILCVTSPANVDRGTGAAVSRVSLGRRGDGGGADGTVAAKRRDAHGGAGAEEGEGGVHAGIREQGTERQGIGCRE